MLRYLRLAFEILAGFIGAVIVLGFVLIWRLNEAPAASTFLTPYIESAINQVLPGTHSVIGHTLLEWNNDNHSLSLHADDITIRDAANNAAVVVPSMNIQVSLFAMVFGHFLPTALDVTHPQIHLTRYENGQWSLGGQTPSEAKSSPDIRHLLERIADNLSQTHLTHKLAISHIVIDIHDATRQASWAVSVPEIILERKGTALFGHARLEVTQKTGIPTVELRYHYDAAEREHEVSMSFEDITPSQLAGGDPAIVGLPQAAMVDMPVTGTLSASFDNHLSVKAATLGLHGVHGRLIIPDLWDQPRSLQSIDTKVTYDKDATKPLQASTSVDFGGPRLSLDLDTSPTLPLSSYDLTYNAALKVDGLPLDQFAQVWPKIAVPDAREWIVSSISKGQLTHGDVTLKGKFAWADLDNLTTDEGSGKLSVTGARVDYLSGLPPVDAVNATADFDLSQMNVQIASGGNGELKLQPFTLQISGLDQDTQIMTIPLKISAPAVDVMTFLNVPRLGYTKALGLTPQDITGRVDGLVNLKFPLLKTLEMKDVDLNAHANLTNIASSKLVNHIDITQGNMTLDLDQDSFTVAGPAALNKVPAQVKWQQFFESALGRPLAQGTVTATVNGDQWTGFGIDALNGTHGPTAVSLQIRQPEKKHTVIDAVMDTNAADLYVEPINWRKPAGVAAVLKFSADIRDGKPVAVRGIDLKGTQIIAKGSATMTEEASRFLSIDLPTMVVGRTNASVHYTEAHDATRAMRVEVSGKSFDITNLSKGNSDAARPQRFAIKLETLYTSETGFMTNVEGHAARTQQAWDEISIHGRAMGEPWLDMNLTPKDDGHRVFALTCDDFGKALHGMGLTATVKGGKLKVHGASTPENPGIVEGTVKVSSFSVSDMPLLMTLMNATSPFGFVDLMTKTMSFDRLKGHFRWQGDDLDLIQVNVPGSAVGLNIEGRVNINSSAANLRGTVVPFSMVNRFLNYIPFLGDILTGGEGQGVLAVAYTISGTLSDPNIGVNPVSLLTPGFVRNLFFGGDEGDDTVDDPDATETEPK